MFRVTDQSGFMPAPASSPKQRIHRVRRAVVIGATATFLGAWLAVFGVGRSAVIQPNTTSVSSSAAASVETGDAAPPPDDGTTTNDTGTNEGADRTSALPSVTSGQS